MTKKRIFRVFLAEKMMHWKFFYNVLLNVRIAVLIMTAVKMRRKERSPEMVINEAFLNRMDFSAFTA